MSKPGIDDKVYAENLSQTNNSNRVIASEDICNEAGAILIKKGAPIDPKAALQIAKHRLKKQLDHTVILDKMLNQRTLMQCFGKLMKIHPELAAIQQQNRLSSFLESSVEFFARNSLLAQKLTVMQQVLPDIFIRTITGAWFATAISVEYGMNTEQVISVTVAALARDLGLLHIDKAIVQKSSKYTATEWRTLQSHVLISKLILDDAGSIPPISKQAVVEHHERADGDGYPKHKFGKQLSEAGQIVGISDALQAILTHRFAISGHTVAHLQGFLTLNMTTWSMDVYKAVIRLIKKGNCQTRLILSKAQVPVFLQNLQIKNKNYLKVCLALEKLRPLLQQASPRTEEMLLLNFSNRIKNMRATTGIPSVEYGQWIEHVYKHRLESAFEEMEMLGLMFDELKWQFSQMDRFISVLAALEISNADKKNGLNFIKKLLSEIL